MGIPRLSFKKPIITRGGNKVRLYHIYEKEIHGAYEVGDDEWKIARWRMDGYFLDPDEQGRQCITTADLINEDEEVVGTQPVSPPHAA